VAEAATRLGITKEAVRKRISRGTLRSDKDQDGTVQVYVPASPTPSGTAEPGTAVDQPLVVELRDRISYLERQLDVRTEELKEHRRLLAAALERVPPAIEAPPDERGSPQGAEPGQEGESPRPGPTPSVESVQRRPWWRRIIGG
jgi:hypothetical protein